MSYTSRHYPHAPITEAIIDLRVDLPAGTDVAILEGVQQGQEAAYPTKHTINTAIGHMQIGPQVSSGIITNHTGFIFKSSDEKQSYQARLDGFTMSRLAPYENWDNFRDEAKRLWRIYQSVAAPSRVTRIAVRYVNRIDIPLPVKDFKEYLRTTPEVSPDLPQGLAGFFMQLMMPLDEIKGLVLINEALTQPVSPEKISIILDLDVFRTEDLQLDENFIWPLLEKLRFYKNKVFEDCLTEKAKEMFK